METSFLTKNVILLLLYVPDDEYIESNTIRGLETPKRICHLMFLSKLMKNPVEREKRCEKHVSALLTDVNSVSMHYCTEHNRLNILI